MQFSVPIYQDRRQWGEMVWHTIGLGPFNTSRTGRSEVRLRHGIEKELRKAILKSSPSELGAMVLSRGLELERVQLELSLRASGTKRKISGTFPLIIEPRWANDEERMLVVYHPMDQHNWFPYDTTRSLEEQATAYYQKAWVDYEDWTIRGMRTAKKDSLKIISFNADTKTLFERLKKKKETLYGDFAIAGGASRKGSLGVLHQLGSPQTSLAAQGALDGGMPREPYRGQLSQLLGGKKKTSALLVGPSGCGKSTLIQRLVHDMLEADDYISHRNLDRVWNVWQLSGRRLIAGMSYVGEWEERCVELLDGVRGKKIVLWIDDLHAWGRIGQSRQSERALADLFRGPIARGELIVIGECTRQQLQQLEEDAPGLAGVLGKVFVEPTPGNETMRMMLHESRKLEEGRSFRFSPMAFRAIIEVGGGLVSATAQPGKSLDLLRALAREGAQRDGLIEPSQVISLLSARTGVPALLLESKKSLDADNLRRELAAQVIGQDEAVDAMVDLILKIKSNLTGTTRPWGVHLFTGPTGTGKTEMAKTLAAYLYGDESRLVRLDMSEYATSDAGARLIGDRWRPDGVLTRQVRQQPFSVVLFDEIEKAHPSVLNLMLQLFDEGRLTDAAGNVADFRHAVVVMTSNLGASKNATIGFGEDASAHKHDQLRAVQDFFSPELFNRIDRIVRFGPLTMEVANIIARKELAKLMGRRGLTERDVFIRMSQAVVDMVAREGFDARDGARSLKRYLERNVAGLLAEEIVARPGNDMRIMRLWRDRQSGELNLQGGTLEEVEPLATASRLEPMLGLSLEALEAHLPAAIDFLEDLRHSDELAGLLDTLRAHLEEFQIARREIQEISQPARQSEELVDLADQIYNLELMRVRIGEFCDRLKEYYDTHVEVDEALLIEHEIGVRATPYEEDSWGMPRLPAHKRRGLDPKALKPTSRRMSQEQLLERLAEVYFLRRALARVHHPDRHAIFIQIFRVGQVHKRKRFGGELATSFVTQLAHAMAMERGEIEEWAMGWRQGEGTSQGADRDSLESALEEHSPDHVVLKLVGLCILDVFEGDDGAHVRLSLGTTPEIVRVRVTPADATTGAADLMQTHHERRRVYERALETGEELPPDPEALGPLVRRLRYDRPEGGGAFTVAVEDFGMAWASRRHVKSLGQALHPLWMLRMGSMDESLSSAPTHDAAEEE